MLSSIKIFIRFFRKNKIFSAINILGLTVGFFSSILIYLYVENEMSYDNFHEKGDRIFRINQTFIWGEDNSNLFSSTGPGVGYAILEEIPEVEQIIRVHTPDLMPVRFKNGRQEKFFNDEYLLAADSNFLEVFSYPLIHGDPKTALDKPNSVIITEEVATRFFGKENALGRMIELGGGELRQAYKITGVLAKTDNLSYIDFDLMISLNSIDRVQRSNWSWIWTMFETFVVLEEGADRMAFQNKLNQLPEKYAHETLEIMGYTWDSYIAAGKEWKLYLQPFEDIYLHSNNLL